MLFTAHITTTTNSVRKLKLNSSLRKTTQSCLLAFSSLFLSFLVWLSLYLSFLSLCLSFLSVSLFPFPPSLPFSFFLSFFLSFFSLSFFPLIFSHFVLFLPSLFLFLTSLHEAEDNINTPSLSLSSGEEGNLNVMLRDLEKDIE